MIACIVCGGVWEIMFVITGLSWLIAWFKKRHNKRKCKCCQEHEKETNNEYK
jgi:tryptophan-rich sensory protein